VARVLDPDATDLESAQEISVRSDSMSPDCGYPWAVELSDGRVLVVYYHVNEERLRGIEGTILEEVAGQC
jgi:hypothetical protein